MAKGNEKPLISSDSRFSKISKSDHIHFCSLEAKDQSSSQLSFFPGGILVPGAGPKEPNVATDSKESEGKRWNMCINIFT